MALSSKNSIQVGVDGNTLVLSFLPIGEQKVWRADMGQSQKSIFAVKDALNKFTLTLKTDGGAEEEITSFDDRKQAVEALQSIAGALLSGGNVMQAPKKGGWFKKLLKLAAALVLIFLLLSVWAKIEQTDGINDAIQAPAVKTGVPVPADQLFGK
jgi:hypothetical protein